MLNCLNKWVLRRCNDHSSIHFLFFAQRNFFIPWELNTGAKEKNNDNIIILQYLHSGLKSSQSYRGTGGFMLNCLNKWVLRCCLKVCTVWQDQKSDGSEFQVCAAVTENDSHE